MVVVIYKLYKIIDKENRKDFYIYIQQAVVNVINKDTV